MCTVSYVPLMEDKKFILTSNRDERAIRRTIAPAVYKHGDVHISYPKDLIAGGSWIAINNKGRISCLLNGAFVPHIKQDIHTQSRGKILIDLVSSELEVNNFFAEKDLFNVEPFTTITIDKKDKKIIEIVECIWDGEKKYLRTIDKALPHIWSSVTLYSKEAREFREKWFSKFLSENLNSISYQKVFEFHSAKHTSDHAINLIMDRAEGLKTVSITQIVQNGTGSFMEYSDLLEDRLYQISL